MRSSPKFVAAAVGAVAVLAVLTAIVLSPPLRADIASAAGTLPGIGTGPAPNCNVTEPSQPSDNGTEASSLALHSLDDGNGTSDGNGTDTGGHDGGCNASSADLDSGTDMDNGQNSTQDAIPVLPSPTAQVGLISPTLLSLGVAFVGPLATSLASASVSAPSG